MAEVKDVSGYEGLYTIDTEGRVYSHKSKRYIKGGSLYSGHQIVCLRKNGIAKMCPIHRLVAVAFLPNPGNLPIVHHIDGNPQNNSVTNLKWCTQKENVHHTIAAGKHGKMNRK